MTINDQIPKSRITLTYRTDVHGQPEDVTLPFRLLLMGDFSNKKSEERKDLDVRPILNLDGTNLDAVMKDMNMRTEFEVENKIDPDTTGSISVDLPVENMKSFTPAVVASNIPKVKGLLLLRKLLLEVQGNIDNRKDFRKTLRELAKNRKKFEEIMKGIAEFEDFKPDSYKVPEAGA